MARFFSKEEEMRIVAAIADAERKTSGEIRVHIEKNCSGDPVNQAIGVFSKLGMNKTELRNAVLIYLAPASHKFAIIGDKGIDELVENDFWECTRDAMLEQFKENRIADGIIAGVERAGERLKQYFPYEKNDTNELSNDISYSEDHEN